MAVEFGLNDPAEAINKTDFDVFSEEHAKQAFADEQRILATGQPIVEAEEKETWPDQQETLGIDYQIANNDKQGNVIRDNGNLS